MKYNPVKSASITVPHSLSEVKELLAVYTSAKKEKNKAEAAGSVFLGKLGEAGFKLAPFARRSCYDPTISGELTEAIEPVPETGDAVAAPAVSTKADLTLSMRPLPKLFTWVWLALCAALLGLALWLCFKKGFDRWYWTLFIGPALFIIERIICNIGFARSAGRAIRTFKELLK